MPLIPSCTLGSVMASLFSAMGVKGKQPLIKKNDNTFRGMWSLLLICINIWHLVSSG